MNLTTLKQTWANTPESHRHIHELFCQLTTADPILDAHRSYIDDHIFGMGERSFQYLWKIILETLPESPKLLEIGVHKAQILSLWKLLREDAQVFGITPLDGRGTGWTEDDYGQHIKNIHDDFELQYPTLFIGGSEEREMINAAFDESPFDVIYVDGDHSYEMALRDLTTYSPLVKKGGYLVIDDCNCDMNFPPSGFFTGIDTVTAAKLKWLETNGDGWEFIASCVHISVFKRK